MKKIRFNIDRGGTFTDIYAEIREGDKDCGYRVLKVLSESDGYENAPREGIRQILNEVLDSKIGLQDKIPTENIDWIRMGTTVATNALLERNSDKKYHGVLPAPKRVALVTTKGFGDLLTIGNQSRPNIFDLTCAKPELLFDHRFIFEVPERVRIRSDMNIEDVPKDDESFRVFPNGEIIQIEQSLPQRNDPEYQELIQNLKKPLEAGVTSIAILFLHSYIFEEHEKAIGKICKELGYTHISLSSKLTKSVKAVARGHTATVDAFLTPYLEEYIRGFKAGFDESINDVDVSFMKSDGGLCPVDHFSGYVSILSGPAGGVVGYAQTTVPNDPDSPPVVGFDMGGTSTDVSRTHAEDYQYVQETQLDGVFIQATQLDINTVAAGGGSVLHNKNGDLDVGPDSVGSDPGPMCYGRGSTRLAITDANFFLGRIVPEYFPFPLDFEATKQGFKAISEEINKANPNHQLSMEEIAMGFIKIANSKMAEAIKTVTEAKGYDVTEHVLAVFGGAGPQHACAIARSLDIQRVVVNRYSAILSAYGLGLANEKEEITEPCRVNFIYCDDNQSHIQRTFEELTGKVKMKLRERKYPDSGIKIKCIVNMRYAGTDTVIPVERPSDGNCVPVFEQNYAREFGFTIAETDILVESLTVVGLASAPKIRQQEYSKSKEPPKEVKTIQCYFNHQDGAGFLPSKVFLLSSLGVGDVIEGPAMVIDPKFFITIVVEPGCTGTLNTFGHFELFVPREKQRTESGVIKRSLFIHRFMNIAEQMGVSLQRTAKSVNIKERLDFSCALFSHTGGLVANAPHLPVHLGAMQYAVKYQLENSVANDWKHGEVILSNHPAAGGSHLPDFTVITPVFHQGEEKEVELDGTKVDLTKPIFYVASRAHHAEIGGITPGSMPPFSRLLVDEGAATKCLKVAVDGKFQLESVLEFLAAPGKVKTPFEIQPSGSRKPMDNVADIKAQIAANNKGIALVQDLIKKYSVKDVLEMMVAVQKAAESAVRAKLITIAKSIPQPLQAVDYMDSGLKIQLKITIDPKSGNAVFDFTGTSEQTFGNVNAPVAVTSSAVIYALRCLVDDDIPLNDGCMIPITMKIPDGSFLKPSDEAAVVGGNVLTSQRVTDVILTAFGAQACSQGCMNNFTFGGDLSPSYYETIAGGAGAGPSWHGQAAVQCHMTNTRITDPEILERRFPVQVLEFRIRSSSGGRGQFNGGDGVKRVVKFLVPMTMSILSERRVIRPHGYGGGLPGKRGKNLLIRNYGKQNEKTINLGAKNSIPVEAGDVFIILTPGGGGYGTPKQ